MECIISAPTDNAGVDLTVSETPVSTTLSPRVASHWAGCRPQPLTPCGVVGPLPAPGRSLRWLRRVASIASRAVAPRNGTGAASARSREQARPHGGCVCPDGGTPPSAGWCSSRGSGAGGSSRGRPEVVVQQRDHVWSDRSDAIQDMKSTASTSKSSGPRSPRSEANTVEFGSSACRRNPRPPLLSPMRM